MSAPVRPDGAPHPAILGSNTVNGSIHSRNATGKEHA
jgi:hypothetical protein